MLDLLEDPVRICDRFVAQARLNPDALAIQAGAEQVTYGQLDHASQSLARHMAVALGATDAVVAIYGKRSPRVILAILACARANVTFAVLDAAYPAERIQQMLRIVQPALVLGVDTEQAALMSVLGTQLAPSRVWPLDAPAAVRLAESGQVDAAMPRAVPATAYLLFTSGTTGVPKCIKTSHRPLAHFVDWYIRSFEVAPGSRFSMLSGLGHDPILRDIFVPLSAGGAIHVPEQADIINPPKLFAWFRTSEVAYAHATPQLLKLLCAGAEPGQTLPHLRYVFSGGDALKMSHVEALKALSPACQPVNFYGTTETPQAMACHRLQAGEVADPIPVGYPIDGVVLHVLSDDFHVLPQGEEGQLAIASDYLSDGYLGDEALTQGRYIRLPDVPGQPSVYLTGDRAVQRADGAMVLKGRIDDQIKIRGFRVELGDIVSALENEPDIRSAVVLPKPQANGENALVAYLVTSMPWDGTAQLRLKAALARKVPGYMVPAHYVVLDALPLLPNGKLDRARLPAIDAPSASDSPAETLQHPVGVALTREWKRILGLPHVRPSQSFVDLGGDSLSFIQASLAIEKILGWVPEGWETLSLEAIARHPAKKAQRGSQVGMPIVLRALSIILVVIAHLSIFTVIGTSTLFVIAGLSFGKFQLRNVLQTHQVKSIFATVLKIMLPALVVIGARQVAQHSFNPYNLLLIGTLFPPEVHEGKNYWFIDVLVQSYLLLAVALLFKRVRNVVRDHVYGVSVAAMCVGMLLAVGQVQADVLNSYATGVSPVKFFWLIFLGIGMSNADTRGKKLLLCGLAFCYVAWAKLFYSGPEFNQSFDLYFLLTVPALLFIPHLRLPAMLARLTTALASASLFIYLSNMTMVKVLSVPALEGHGHAPLKIAITLAVGVFAWWAWEAMLTQGAKLKSKLVGMRGSEAAVSSFG